MLNVGQSRDFDVVSSLLDINTIKGGYEALLLKERGFFTRKLKAASNLSVDTRSYAGVGSGQSKIVNLAKKENFNTIDGSGGGRMKANVVEDGRNVLFP